MGADEIIPKMWLGRYCSPYLQITYRIWRLTLSSTLSGENASKVSITAVVQVSASKLPASISAAYQKESIEPVQFQIEHANLLPVLEPFCTFMTQRLQAKRRTLILENGGGTACLVAYCELPCISTVWWHVPRPRTC